VTLLAAIVDNLSEAGPVEAGLAVGHAQWGLADHRGAAGQGAAPGAVGTTEDRVHILEDVVTRVTVVGECCSLGQIVWQSSGYVTIRHPETRFLNYLQNIVTTLPVPVSSDKKTIYSTTGIYFIHVVT
jgi:hypothetical protein